MQKKEMRLPACRKYNAIPWVCVYVCGEVFAPWKHFTCHFILTSRWTVCGIYSLCTRHCQSVPEQRTSYNVERNGDTAIADFRDVDAEGGGLWDSSITWPDSEFSPPDSSKSEGTWSKRKKSWKLWRELGSLFFLRRGVREGRATE